MDFLEILNSSVLRGSWELSAILVSDQIDVFLHPLCIILCQVSSIFNSLRSHCMWLHGVYLTSRIEGLDSMMATMILSM